MARILPLGALYDGTTLRGNAGMVAKDALGCPLRQYAHTARDHGLRAKVRGRGACAETVGVIRSRTDISAGSVPFAKNPNHWLARGMGEGRGKQLRLSPWDHRTYRPSDPGQKATGAWTSVRAPAGRRAGGNCSPRTAAETCATRAEEGPDPRRRAGSSATRAGGNLSPRTRAETSAPRQGKPASSDAGRTKRNCAGRNHCLRAEAGISAPRREKPTSSDDGGTKRNPCWQKPMSSDKGGNQYTAPRETRTSGLWRNEAHRAGRNHCPRAEAETGANPASSETRVLRQGRSKARRGPERHMSIGSSFLGPSVEPQGLRTQRRNGSAPSDGPRTDGGTVLHLPSGERRGFRVGQPQRLAAAVTHMGDRKSVV